MNSYSQLLTNTKKKNTEKKKKTAPLLNYLSVDITTTQDFEAEVNTQAEFYKAINFDWNKTSHSGFGIIYKERLHLLRASVKL